MKEFFKNFKRVYKFSKGSRRYIVIYFITSIIISLVGVVVPILTSLQLVNLTNGFWDKLIIYTLLLFGINIFDNLIGFVLSISSRKFSKIVISKIQMNLGSEILKIKLSDIDKHSNGVFIQRLTSDASSISSIFTYGIDLFNRIIKDLAIFIIIFGINFWLGIFFLIFLIIFAILQRIRVKLLDIKDDEYRNQREKTSGFTTELIRGIRDIKMLNAENTFMKKIKEEILSLNDHSYGLFFTNRVFGLLNGFIISLFDLILILLIIINVRNNILSVALGVVVYSYRNHVKSIVYDVSGILDYVREFNLSCKRVFDVLDGDEFKKESFGIKHLDNVNGDFSFKDVTFSYGDGIVLDKVNFDVKANETVGFVGSSGSGKSTIFNLLCKLYDNYEGVITIDGYNIKELDRDSIRGSITIINQNPYIFNMSIKDNLRMVKENLTDEEMVEACKLACLDDFINTLKDGYDTIVGEGGVTLSGGQRQRLAIARALVQKTEIILFDEATSALDNETQAKIQEAINNMKNEYTILIIAHRMSTIVNCDRIIFIDNGKIIDSGTHKELLKNNKLYKKLYESEIMEE